MMTQQEGKHGASWTARQWADWFKSAYRDVLCLTPETEAGEDGYWVHDALEVFGRMSGETQALLRDEKAALDRLRGRGGSKPVSPAA